MRKEESKEVLEAPIPTHETEEGSSSNSKEQHSNRSDSPVRSPQSSKMTAIDDVDGSLRSVGDSNRSLRSGGSKDRDGIRSIEAHAQGMLQTMENAKKALFASPKAKPKKSESQKLFGKTPVFKPSKLDEDGSNKEAKPRTRTKQHESSRREKTRKLSNSKSKQVDVSPIARAKGKIDAGLRRITPNGIFSNNVEKKTQSSREKAKDGSNEKIDMRRRRQRPEKQTPRDAVFEEPPKVQGETNTDTTHDENYDGIDDDESSSMDFKLTNDRDSSDKDQECDSSSSTVSGSNTQKTEGGLLENEKSDKVISASRYIFISILIVAAIVIASLSFFLFRREDYKTFMKAVSVFELMCEAIVKFIILFHSRLTFHSPCLNFSLIDLIPWNNSVRSSS